MNIEDKEEDGTKIENAVNGQVGVHIQNRKYPREPNSFNDYNHSQIINVYRNYVRANLANHIRESELKTFLTDLDIDKRVQSKYSLLSFMDELLGMEKQYFELHHRLSFDPIVRSLRMRIDE